MGTNSNFANKIKRIFLAEPFTEKGLSNLSQIKVPMSKKDFFDKQVYIEPFTEYSKTKNEILDETYTGNENVLEDAYNGATYSEEVSLKSLTLVEDTFETKISDLDGWLFVIKGVAGSGKTTYLNYLKNKFSDKIVFHIFNFEETKQSVSFMSTTFDLEEQYYNNVCKVFSLLLIEVANVLSKNNKKNDEHIEFVKKIVEKYNSSFKISEENVLESGLLTPNVDIIEQQNLFELLEQYSKQRIDYAELSQKILDAFRKKLLSSGAETTLASIVGFIIRLYYCLNKINGKKHLCVVDNIETFVKYDEEHPVQVCEIEKIIKCFFSASHKVREIFAPWKQVGKFETFYSFMIVTRDTTASTALCEVQHEDDYKNENEVDISNWYCTEDILESKKSFFLENKVVIPDDCYSKAYQSILCDFSKYHWGLSEIISKMYKHSHRRNIECIPDAIAVIPEDEIIYFNEMWKKAQGREVEKSSLKLMCRKYIFRILIDHIQRKKYFDNLMVENSPVNDKQRTLENVFDTINDKPSHEESSSYARKISTILYRFSLHGGRDRYISFPRLINSILKPINLPDEPTDSRIRNLGKILFLMNETRNEITNWTSLVCMKFSSTRIYSEESLCNILVDEWNNYKNGTIEIDDTSKFGVKITDAGGFFAKILPDFEYFCCRFLSSEPPLFSLNNLKYFTLYGKRSFRAIAIIRFIRKKAFACIDEVIDRDKSFFSSLDSHNIDFSPMYDSQYSWLYKDSDTSEAIVHPLRVIEQHCGYISNYLYYIEKYVPTDKFKEPEDKDQFIRELRIELSKYHEKLQKLIRDNPKYFKK